MQGIDPDQVFIHPYGFLLKWLVLLLSNIEILIICFGQAEEMLDVASRYLLFPLKRAVADVLLPHLEMVSPEELCHWLILADM